MQKILSNLSGCARSRVAMIYSYLNLYIRQEETIQKNHLSFDTIRIFVLFKYPAVIKVDHYCRFFHFPDPEYFF